MWPSYSRECRADINDHLRRNLSLTAYRANPTVGVGPSKGSQAERLEREIEKKFKVRHAIAVSSGTAALHAALVALDVRGREVVTSPYSFSATVSSILLAGGTPRFADVDPHHFCITKESVKRAITKKTAAILPVHLFGYFQDPEGLKSFGLPVVEDACQAVGASRSLLRDTAYSGTVGCAGAYSFNGSKNIPAGEGGALVTNDDAIAEKARRFINHSENFGTQEVGVNYRMHELVACLARHGLESLDGRNERRRQLAWRVMGETATLGEFKRVEWHRHYFDLQPDAHAFYVVPFKIHGVPRSRFISRCAKRGLPVGAGYITPILSDYPAFRRFKTAPLPVAEELSSKTLCLLSTLTPDRPLSYARWCAKVIRESLS